MIMFVTKQYNQIFYIFVIKNKGNLKNVIINYKSFFDIM